MKIENLQLTTPQTDVWVLAGTAVIAFTFGVVTMPSGFAGLMLFAGAVNGFNAWRLLRRIKREQE